MSIRPVFHDPSGRRSRVLRSVLVVLGAGVALLGGSFAIGVLQPPVVEPLPLTTTVAARRVGQAAASTLRPCAKRCPPMATAQHVGSPVSDPIVAGFVVQWDAGSRAALKRYGDHLDWVIVEGAFLGRGKPGEITVTHARRAPGRVPNVRATAWRNEYSVVSVAS